MSLVIPEHRVPGHVTLRAQGTWACNSEKRFAATCCASEVRGQLCHVRGASWPCKKEVSRQRPQAAASLLFTPTVSWDPSKSRKDGQTHLVCDFDKKAESLGGLEKQPAGDVLAEILGLGAGLHLKSLRVALTQQLQGLPHSL